MFYIHEHTHTHDNDRNDVTKFVIEIRRQRIYNPKRPLGAL